MTKKSSFQILMRPDRVLLLIVICLALAAPAAEARQNQTADLTALQVELWPDYDRPAMLVLMNGTLPPNATLPATVGIPLPPGAEVNAVARMSDENQLMADVEHSVGDDELTITLNDHYFRVEYYAPYVTNGQQRAYAFNWLSDMAVGQLAMSIQQPAAAENLTIAPEAVNVSDSRGDGLLYHSLPSRAVAPGDLYTVNVSYETPTGALTAQPTDQNTGTASQTGLGLGFSPWWLLAAVGVAVLVSGGWYLGQRGGKPSGRARKPAPTRGPKPQPANESARFCHVCGQKAEAGDQFCRRCGTQLKTPQ